MKKHIRGIIILVLFVAGIAILTYPYVSNYLAKQNQSKAILDYKTSVEDITDEQQMKEREKAKAYNDCLSGEAIEDPFIPGSGIVLPKNYQEILNIEGIMGYIDIPKIDVHIPIYHGASEEVLQKGIGHLKETALPIGGEGNHVVLSGHRGLSKAKLFSDLDKMEEGDIFYLHVLGDVLAYQVDQIKVIEPTETEDLLPVEGKDYVTLVTCTPYAVNTHRLLVRGIRIPYTEEVEQTEEKETKTDTPLTVYLIVAVAVVVLVWVFILMIWRYRNKRRGR